MSVQLSTRERNAIRYGGTVRKGQQDDFRAFCAAHNLTIEAWDSRTGGRWIYSGKLAAFTGDRTTLDAAFNAGWSISAVR